MHHQGSSLAVQWLGLGAFTAMAPGSIPIPGWGIKIPQAVQCGPPKKSIIRSPAVGTQLTDGLAASFLDPSP